MNLRKATIETILYFIYKEGEVSLFYKTNMLRFCYKSGKKWLSCLSIVLLLMSIFPAAALGSTIAIAAVVPGGGAMNETNIRTNGLIIDITLPTGTTWATNIASTIPTVYPDPINSVFIPAIKGSFGTTTDVTQWSNLLSHIPDANFTLESNSTTVAKIQITIPIPSTTTPPTTYDILSDQVVTFTPLVSLLQDSSNIPAAMSFTITADPQATLSGSLTTGVTESNIVSGGRQLIITLVNCLWDSNVATDATKRAKLFSALNVAVTATPANDAQWNTVVYNALIAAPDPSKVITKDSSSTIVTITLPPVPSYNISGLQTVTLSSLDPSLFSPSTGPAINNIINSSIIINPDANSIISLTTTPAILTETTIITGTTPTTLKMTLSDNTWASDITTNLARQTALMNGFTASTDVTAWNNVKAAILPTTPAYFFLSPDLHDLTITIPAISNYNILTNQLVTVNVPATVLTTNYQPSNSLSFTVIADPAVAVSGTLTAGANEMDIVNGNKTIVATLTNATWASSVTIDRTLREQLIDKLLASVPAWPTTTTNPTDAIATIKAGATYTLTNPSTVTITLPPVPGFNISTPLTITPLIPTLSALIVPPSGGTYQASIIPPFTIAPISNQSASISGTVITASPIESDIVTGGKTLVITLKNDVWAQDVVSKYSVLGNNITVGTPAVAVFSLQSSNVVRTNDTVLTITLPPAPGYTCATDQTINVKIPGTTLATSSQDITAGSFTVKAITATLGGTAVITPLNSTSVVAGGKTIVITLKNATWASDVITNSTKFGALKACFSSSSTPPVPTLNWNQVSGAILPEHITRSSNNVITIKLPKITSYVDNNIPEYLKFSNSSALFPTLINETISTSKILTAFPTMQIGQTAQTPITATLSGSAVNMAVSDIVTGGKIIKIQLSGGSWDQSLPTTRSKISTLVSGFTATANSDSTSWAMVQTALKSADLVTNNPFVLSKSLSTLTNNDILTITLPVVPGYDPMKSQTIKITIPKSVLVPTTANVDVGQLSITVPSYTSSVTLQSKIDDGSLANDISNMSLQRILLLVPTKFLTSVVSKQSAIGNTIINSLDISTDSSVESVNVRINEKDYTSTTPILTNGSVKKFNIGFTTEKTTTTATSSPDAIISVLRSNTKLQSDVTVKMAASKTYSLAPTTDLSGAYSLYKLVNNPGLLTNILKYYGPADITVKTI